MGLPCGLNDAEANILNGIYNNYMSTIPDGEAKTNGIVLGQRVAQVIVGLRQNDGRCVTPTFTPPPPGPGVWQPNTWPGPLPVGVLLPGTTPLALESASQFRPDGPNDLTSDEYTEDFNQVKALGGDQIVTPSARTPAQTEQALFWTDHDIRQWNDGMLNLVTAQGLDLVHAARMLAMAHVAGGDGMIACFDANTTTCFGVQSRQFARPTPMATQPPSRTRRGHRWARHRIIPSILRRTLLTAPQWPEHCKPSSAPTEFLSCWTAE